MDKPWLLSPKDITWQQWKSDPNAVCRAQHLKTLEWVNQHMFSLIQDGTTFGMQKWESLLAQARKDVEE